MSKLSKNSLIIAFLIILIVNLNSCSAAPTKTTISKEKAYNIMVKTFITSCILTLAIEYKMISIEPKLIQYCESIYIRYVTGEMKLIFHQVRIPMRKVILKKGIL